MFKEIQVLIDYSLVGITIAIIALVIFFIYISILSISFIYMAKFNNDLKKKRESLNIGIYQKCEYLNKLAIILEKYLNENSPLKIFSLNEEFKKYTKLKVDEIEEFYSYTEKILKDAQKNYIDYDLGAEKKEVEGIFLAISDINKNYLETVQIYNSLVIGYNYWRNLFSTRWFKHILFIREKKSIK